MNINIEDRSYLNGVEQHLKTEGNPSDINVSIPVDYDDAFSEHVYHKESFDFVSEVISKFEELGYIYVSTNHDDELTLGRAYAPPQTLERLSFHRAS